MRYMEFFGLLDDIFAMYRKEELDEGKNMLKYHYYQGLNSVKDGYTVYLGQVVDEVRALLKRLQEEEITWQNGWIINSAGAKELLKTFHLDNDRYYYEHMFRNTNIDVIGIVSNKCDINNLDHTYMWNLIWTYFNK